MRTYVAALMTAFAAATSEPWAGDSTLVNNDDIAAQATAFSFDT